ncbi:MAG TPA: 5-deoxy-glucuronate isomerase [Vitreimonas sp.]|uniref:5-deoxy-glucuronate isomerase n=1 Tax=Vitreimonas sp. TaxID=3069702 RepID=UPI002D25BB65|nr:5-deoxy-glucuronate isomerase [Vitreimonas sp.]HYD88824.1 5-deoxy-glucuronate isomerase [Vitreimonas sp.]
MSELRVRPKPRDDSGAVLEVTPQSAGWTYVGFKVIALEPGEAAGGGEPDREACIIVLSGRCDVDVGQQRFENIGERMSVFEDKSPAAVYAPAGVLYAIIARTAVEIAVGTAPGSGAGEARLISAEHISKETRGAGTNMRYVRNILPETEPAESLLIAEVITPGGNWSSYPPHKHDRLAPPEESALEEIYYHRLNPKQGFAFQRVYTDDRSIDETVCVEDGDVVLVPRGYHPVGAPHGYDLYYLNIMAGPQRTWIFNNDPAHAWIAQKK